MTGIAPRGDGMQLVSSVGQAVYAYDVSGRELWRVRHKGWSIVPRPVAGHGLVFAIVDHDHPELWAIRHDGSGDVTESHIAWKETRSMPARCTPLLVDDLLYVVNRTGLITCLEARTGGLVWKERLEGQYSATPIFTKDRIYLFNEEATCTILRPGRKFDVLAVNSLANQSVRATPAVDRNSLIVRTADSLYRIETAATDPRQSAANTDDSTQPLPFYPRGRCLAFLVGSSVSMSRFQSKNWQRSDYRRSVAGHLGMKVGWSQSLDASTSNQRSVPVADNGFASPKTTSKTPDPCDCLFDCLDKLFPFDSLYHF